MLFENRPWRVLIHQSTDLFLLFLLQGAQQLSVKLGRRGDQGVIRLNCGDGQSEAEGQETSQVTLTGAERRFNV